MTVIREFMAELAATAGVRVLRAAGAEFEDESFSGLNQLLLPLRGELDRLDDLHRTALNAALGLGDGPARDRLVVSSAVLALLSRVAADGPLLLIVDNLPWMDQASVWVLGFVARRLSGSRVGFLAAQRSARSAVLDLDLPRHEVPPLDEVASVRLVSTRCPDVAPGVRRQIVAQAQGNALALMELPLTLSDQQRAGRELRQVGPGLRGGPGGQEIKPSTASQSPAITHDVTRSLERPQPKVRPETGSRAKLSARDTGSRQPAERSNEPVPTG